MRWTWVVVLFVACSSPSATPPYGPRAPVLPDAEVAFEPFAGLLLPTHFTPHNYKAVLAVDPAKPTLHGTIEIEGDLDRLSAAVLLNARDLTLRSASATRNGVKTRLYFQPRDADVVELRAEPALEAGAWTIAIEYDAAITKEVRGAFRVDSGADAYVYTYFEPIHARRVFPCFDEPGRKTPWELTLEVPHDQIAVSNTEVVETIPLDDGRVRFRFAKTKPLPSYLVAFGVGPFEVVQAGTTKSGIPLRLIVPRGSGERSAFLRTSLARIVDHLEGWFGIPFPYSKLDVMAVTAMGGGAMEHAGLITADASYVLLDPMAMSWNQRLESVATIGHEAAHQWFGDLVTPTWWDETWLKESFATWMEHKVTGAFEPAWDDERSIATKRLRAFRADSLTTARQIRQPITFREEIGETFDVITYSKGGSVLAMFEHFVGPAVFQQGVHDYFAAHMHGNATTADLLGAIENASGKKLAHAFSTFVDQPGVPMIEATLACDAPGPRVRVTQSRFLKLGSRNASLTKPWEIPVCIAYDRDGQRAEMCTLVDGDGDIELAAKACPKWVLPNAGGVGYYRFATSEAATTALRDVAWPLLTWPERRALIDDVRAQVLLGKLTVGLLASFVTKVANGDDRFTFGDVLDYRGLPSDLGRLAGDDLLPSLNAWVRTTFGSAARKRDFMVSPKDSLGDELTRSSLIRAATEADEPALVARAVKLAANYRALPQATRELVLPVAARKSTAIAARLRTDALVETDHDLRSLQLQSLAKAGLSLDLALDPRIPNEDVVWFIVSARNTGQLIVRWMNEHSAELLARYPANDTFAPFLLYAFFTCDPAKHDSTVGTMTQLFGKMPGAARLLQQRVEDIDQCIAEREVVEPSLRAWLRAAKSR